MILKPRNCESRGASYPKLVLLLLQDSNCVASIGLPFDALTFAEGTPLTSHDNCYGSRRPGPLFHTALSTIQAPLFARLLAELIASKGRPHLSQMITLLPRNRICSDFISWPVNVRLALSPPRSPPFLSNKFLSNGDHRSCTPKRQAPAPYSRRPVSRSGVRHAKTSSYRAKNSRQVLPISIPPKEWICGSYL
jgi:hypothetical protein